MRNDIEALEISTAEAAAATERLGEKRQSLLTAIKTKEAELDSAEGGPLPPKDLAKQMRVWLGGYLDSLHEDIGWLVPVTMAGGEQPRAGGDRNERLVHLLLEDLLDQAIEPFIKNRLGGYTHGLPAAERPAAIKRLSSQLAKLKCQDEELVDNAHRLGFAGPAWEHRPEVRQSREAAESKRKTEEREVARRLEREAAINERFNQDAKPRSVRSRYIESGKRKV